MDNKNFEKKFNELLFTNGGTLKVNQYCTLYRQIDIENKVDILWAIFRFGDDDTIRENSICTHIKYRDHRNALRQIAERQKLGLEQLSKALDKQLDKLF